MTPQPTAADTAPARVLIVDDNPANRYVLGTSLRRAGHTVIEAGDGAQALGFLADPADALPDVAVVDVRLPDMTGFEVCERIKTDPRTAAIPVVHVSASAISAADRTQGLYRGADAYLTEPIAPEELVATLTATLRYARARARAERLAERLGRLNAATLALYSAKDAAALAHAAAEGAGGTLGTDAAVMLADPQHAQLAHVVSGDGGDISAGPRTLADFRALLAGHPLGEASGAALHAVPAGRWPGRRVFPGHERMALAAARAKPGRPPVCIAVPADALTPDDHDLLTQLAHACALALEALRTFSEEHTLALTLQRTFLPERLPDTERALLAVRYLPASATTEIGGDFYEALHTPSGLLLAVGDVAGHSLDAAVVMGQLRHALRAYALEGHGPQDILTRLEHLLHTLEPSQTATLCVVLAEHDSDTLHIANAGHLPPLIRRPGERALYLTDHGPLLGLGLPHPPATVTQAPPGTALVMVTDGLLERRGTDLGDRLAELETVFDAGPVDDPEAMCEHLLELFPPDGEDDIALMAITLTAGERQAAEGEVPR